MSRTPSEKRRGSETRPWIARTAASTASRMVPVSFQRSRGADSIATPIGPIAFDYGFNLERYRWEDVGAPNFSIGLF